MKKQKIISTLMLSTIILSQAAPVFANAQDILTAPESSLVIEKPTDEAPVEEETPETSEAATDVEESTTEPAPVTPTVEGETHSRSETSQDWNGMLYTFEDGVLTITGGVVSGYYKLNAFEIDLGVTITSVVFTDDDGGAVADWYMYYFFDSLADLTSVAGFEYLDTSGTGRMDSLFANTPSLSVIDLSQLNTENVVNMSGMFYGASALTSLDLSNFDMSGVTYKSNMLNVGTTAKLTTLILGEYTDISGTDLPTNATDKRWSSAGRVKTSTNLMSDSATPANTAGTWSLQDYWSGVTYTFEAGELTITGGTLESMAYLKQLQRDTLSESITKVIFSNEIITGEYLWLFMGLETLKSIENIYLLKLQNTWSTGFMFSGTSGLEEVDLSGLDTSNVVDMNAMFAESGVSELTFGGSFSTANVKNMSSMFCATPNLKDLDLSTFDSTNLSYASNMFESSKIENLDISSLDTRGVTRTYMFTGATALTSLTLGADTDISGSGLPSITAKAWNRENTPPSSTVKTSTNLMADSATPANTAGTWNLQDYWSGVTYIWNETDKELRITGGTFVDNSWLDQLKPNVKTIEFTHTVKAAVNSSYLFDRLYSLEEIKGLSKLDTTATQIMSGFFSNTPELRRLNLEGFKTAGVTHMSEMFRNAGLEELDLSEFDTSDITSMSYMFSGASSLAELDLSSFNTEEVEGMSYMFSNASSLTELNLSSFNTEKVTSMSYMFSNASSLKELDLSNFNTEKVTMMRYMFENATALEKLDVSSFKTPLVINMERMFYNTSKLKALDLSGFDTTKIVAYSYTNWQNMLGGTTSLTSLTLGDKTNISKSQVSGTTTYTFGLSDINVPAGYQNRWTLQPELERVPASTQKTSQELMTLTGTTGDATGTWRREAQFEAVPSNFAVASNATDADLRTEIAAALKLLDHNNLDENNDSIPVELGDDDLDKMVEQLHEQLGSTSGDLPVGKNPSLSLNLTYNDTEFVFDFTLFVADGITTFAANDHFVSFDHFEYSFNARASLVVDKLIDEGEFEVIQISTDTFVEAGLDAVLDFNLDDVAALHNATEPDTYEVGVTVMEPTTRAVATQATLEVTLFDDRETLTVIEDHVQPYAGQTISLPISDLFAFADGFGVEDYDFELVSGPENASLAFVAGEWILTGADAGDYEIRATRLGTPEGIVDSATSSFTIGQAQLEIGQGQVASRTFDGSVDAEVTSAPQILGLADGDEAHFVGDATDIAFAAAIVGTNSFVGGDWSLEFADGVNPDNYILPESSVNGRAVQTYTVNDLFTSEGITQADGALLRVGQGQHTHNTLNSSAVLHHDETDETGPAWYLDHEEELMENITFTLYATNPDLARAVPKALATNSTGVFTNLNPETTYYVTATSDASHNFSSGVESAAVAMTTLAAPTIDNGNGGEDQNGDKIGGNDQNGGDDLTTGAENVPAPGKDLPATGDIAGGFAGLLGLGSLFAGFNLWRKRRK